MSYIEREALWRAMQLVIEDSTCPLHIAATVDQYITEAPAADVAPVVHGRWVDHMVRDWRCSECGEPIYKVRHVDGYCYNDKPNYCPYCGAKMDGGADA